MFYDIFGKILVKIHRKKSSFTFDGVKIQNTSKYISLTYSVYNLIKLKVFLGFYEPFFHIFTSQKQFSNQEMYVYKK